MINSVVIFAIYYMTDGFNYLSYKKISNLNLKTTSRVSQHTASHLEFEV